MAEQQVAEACGHDSGRGPTCELYKGHDGNHAGRHPSSGITDYWMAEPGAVREVNYVTKVNDLEPDAPLCNICGALMVKDESDWKCLSCGNRAAAVPEDPKEPWRKSICIKCRQECWLSPLSKTWLHWNHGDTFKCGRFAEPAVDGGTYPAAAEPQQASTEPVAWRYVLLVNKHTTGKPLLGEIKIDDVWGIPGSFRYSEKEPTDLYLVEKVPLYSKAEVAALKQSLEDCVKALERIAEIYRTTDPCPYAGTGEFNNHSTGDCVHCIALAAARALMEGR